MAIGHSPLLSVFLISYKKSSRRIPYTWRNIISSLSCKKAGYIPFYGIIPCLIFHLYFSVITNLSKEPYDFVSTFTKHPLYLDCSSVGLNHSISVLLYYMQLPSLCQQILTVTFFTGCMLF